MSERLIVIDWYTGASLFYTVYSEAGATLQARTAMSESPSGSGCFVHSNSVWDDSWAGRLVFDDGVLFESRAYTGTPPTAGSIAAAVLDEAKGAHTGILAGVATEATAGLAKAAAEKVAGLVETNGGVDRFKAAAMTAGVTLTSDERAAIATSIETAIMNDDTGLAIRQAIVDTLVENMPNLDDLSISSIASATATAIASALPTAEQINELLTTSHGNGQWDGANVNVTTEEISIVTGE